MKIDFLKIWPVGFSKTKSKGLLQLVQSIEYLIEDIISRSKIDFWQHSKFIPLDFCFKNLDLSLPLINLKKDSKNPFLFSIQALFKQKYSEDLLAFLSNSILQTLLNKTCKDFCFTRSLVFYFIVQPSKHYLVSDWCIEVSSEQERRQLEKNFPIWSQNISRTIISVLHTKKESSDSSRNYYEKREKIYEIFSTIKPTFSIEDKNELYSQVYQIMAPKHIQPNPKQNVMGLNYFFDFHAVLNLFPSEFFTIRKEEQLKDIFSTLYFIKKNLHQKKQNLAHAQNLNTPHVLSVMSISIDNIPALAFAIGIKYPSFISDIDYKKPLKLVEELVFRKYKNLRLYFTKAFNDNQYSLIYFEIQHILGLSLSKKITHHVKKDLKSYINKYLNGLLHCPAPLDKEVAKIIITLSNDLTCPLSAPKITLVSKKQNLKKPIFTAVIAYVSDQIQPCKTIQLTTPLAVTKQSIRHIGSFDNGHLKIAHIYEIKVDKSSKDILQLKRQIIESFKLYYVELQEYCISFENKKEENLKYFIQSIAPRHHKIGKEFFDSLVPKSTQTFECINPLLFLFNLMLDQVNTPYVPGGKNIQYIQQEKSYFIAEHSSKLHGFESLTSKYVSSQDSLIKAFISTQDKNIFGTIASKNFNEKNFTKHLKSFDQFVRL